ncbi:hypothetical protein BpHYR1_045662, partial [Brachionus plicatilis]
MQIVKFKLTPNTYTHSHIHTRTMSNLSPYTQKKSSGFSIDSIINSYSSTSPSSRSSSSSQMAEKQTPPPPMAPFSPPVYAPPPHPMWSDFSEP